MALRSFACLAFAIVLQPERTMASLDGAVGGDCAGENPAACAADGDIAAVESWEADAMRMEMLQRRVLRRASRLSKQELGEGSERHRAVVPLPSSTTL